MPSKIIMITRSFNGRGKRQQTIPPDAAGSRQERTSPSGRLAESLWARGVGTAKQPAGLPSKAAACTRRVGTQNRSEKPAPCKAGAAN